MTHSFSGVSLRLTGSKAETSRWRSLGRGELLTQGLQEAGREGRTREELTPCQVTLPVTYFQAGPTSSEHIQLLQLDSRMDSSTHCSMIPIIQSPSKSPTCEHLRLTEDILDLNQNQLRNTETLGLWGSRHGGQGGNHSAISCPASRPS